MDKRHLYRNGKIWNVRLRVPTDVLPLVGQREMKESLKTTELKTANRLKHAKLKAWRDGFEQLRADYSSTAAGQVEQAMQVHLAKLKLGVEIPESEKLGLRVLIDEVWDKSWEEKAIPRDEEALAVAAHAYRLLDREEPVQTLSGALEAHLEEFAAARRPSTVKNRRKRVSAFMQWLPSGTYRPVAEITRKEAGAYVTEVISPKDRAVKTKKDEVNTLSSFFKWCVTKGMTEANPFFQQSSTIVDTKRGVEREGQLREWKPDELRELLTGIKDKRGKKDPLWSLTVIAAYSGMRAEEIASMEVKNVHAGAVLPYMRIREGKTDAALRSVPIHPLILPMVRSLAAGAKKDGYLIPELKPSGYDGKRFHGQSKCFGYLTGTAIKIADNKGLNFHSLRKSFTGTLERAGITENVIQQLIGHKKPSLAFSTYSDGMHLDQLADAVERVSYGEAVDELVR